jgi:Mg2+-importing ATPase
VESLATQTLVIFVIRTRRVPFFHSRPSLPLAVTSIACVVIGVALPFSPLAGVLGFTSLPIGFLAILVVMVITYLALVEAGKARFFRPEKGTQPLARPRTHVQRRIGRLLTRWMRPGGRRP